MGPDHLITSKILIRKVKVIKGNVKSVKTVVPYKLNLKSPRVFCLQPLHQQIQQNVVYKHDGSD